MFTLLRKLIWVLFFAAITFGFVVLFEYGPVDYAQNALKEWKKLQSAAQKLWEKKSL